MSISGIFLMFTESLCLEWSTKGAKRSVKMWTSKIFFVYERSAVKDSFSTYVLRMLCPGRFILVESVYKDIYLWYFFNFEFFSEIMRYEIIYLKLRFAGIRSQIQNACYELGYRPPSQWNVSILSTNCQLMTAVPSKMVKNGLEFGKWILNVHEIGISSSKTDWIKYFA